MLICLSMRTTDTTENEKIETPFFSYGSIIASLHPTKLIRSHIDVTIDLSTPTFIKAQIRELISPLNNIQKIMKKEIAAGRNQSKYYRYGEFSLFNNIMEIGSSLAKQVGDLTKLSWMTLSEEDINVDVNKTYRRGKRALLPFIGKIMGDIFGLATEQDNQHIDENFSIIDMSLDNLTNSLGSTISQLKSNSKYMNGLADRINRLETDLSTVEKGHEVLLHSTVLITQLYQIDSFIDHVYRYHTGIESIMSKAARHETPNDVLPFSKLSKMIDSAAEKLKASPLFRLNIRNYVDFLQHTYTVPVSDIDEEKIIIIIPLFDSVTYKTYRVYTIPTPSNNNTITGRITFETDEPIICVFDLDFFFFTLTELEYSHCIHRRDLHICPPLAEKQHYNNKMPDCAISLIRRSSLNCAFHDYYIKTPAVVFVQGIQLISIMTPMIGKLICPHEEKLVEWTGLQIIPSSCRFLSDKLEVYSSDSVVYNSSIPETLLPHNTITYNFTLMKRDKVQIYPALKANAWLDKLDHLDQNTRFQSSHLHHLTHGLYSVSIGTGTLLIMTIGFIILAYKLNMCTHIRTYFRNPMPTYDTSVPLQTYHAPTIPRVTNITNMITEQRQQRVIATRSPTLPPQYSTHPMLTTLPEDDERTNNNVNSNPDQLPQSDYINMNMSNVNEQPTTSRDVTDSGYYEIPDVKKRSITALFDTLRSIRV